MGVASADRLFRHGLYLFVLAIFLRLMFLGVTDLLDPTESRYASVAQEMVISNDWITPAIPGRNGIEPYLGKPPFHFWLTAIAYSVFGVAEWTSRLPSSVSALLILCAIGSFTSRAYDRRTALLACWVAFTSCMFFFLAGASVLDVTLTALVTLSFLQLQSHLDSEGQRGSRPAVIGALFAALAFLTKGPVALVLIGLPLFLWLISTRQFGRLKSFPWASTTLVFIAVAAPWFVASEVANPGFLEYFFWNENVARYLFEDYGDRYGRGHTHVYGMSWIMMFIAFCPWTLVVIYTIWRKGIRWTIEQVRSDQTLRLMLIWGLSPALFFTFVRQLHGMYLLPAVPGLAIFSARLILRAFETTSSPVERSRLLLPGELIRISTFAGATVMIAASLFFAPSFYPLLAILPLGYLIRSSRESGSSGALFGSMINSGGSVAALYVIVLTCATPILESRMSATRILDKVAESGTGETASIALINANKYSPWWMARAWKTELSAPVTVFYIHPNEIGSEGVKDVLIRAGQENRLPPAQLPNFRTVMQDGGWKWITRTTQTARIAGQDP